MIRFSELKRGDVVYFVLYSGGCYSVAHGVFERTYKYSDVEKVAIVSQLDKGAAVVHQQIKRKTLRFFAEALHRTQEEAELHAVMSAIR